MLYVSANEKAVSLNLHRYNAVHASPEGEPLRVYAKGAAFPGIAMSRSLGDQTASMLGVIPDPAVTLHEVPVGAGRRGGGGGDGEDENFLLLGTDGLWGVFTPEDAAEMIEAAVNVAGRCTLCILLTHLLLV
jgi:serine/threonine protein phosphatase PrpC